MKTLASAPGLSTQQQVPLEDRLKTGIKSTTIRMSVGMENIEDICADIDQALVLAVPVPVPIDDTPSVNVASVTQGLSEVSVSINISSGIAQKTARLKAVYDQLSALSAEAEELQTAIKKDSALLREQGTTV